MQVPRKGLRLLVVIIGILIFLRTLQWLNNINYVTIDSSKNFFALMPDLANGPFLVDNDKCRIPDVPSTANKIPVKKTEAEACHGRIPNLTYVDNQEVIINEDVIRELGYQRNGVTCCYNTVDRVEQSPSSFDWVNADNQYSYSTECFPMKTVTRPISAFIYVTCTLSHRLSIFWPNTYYDKFHLIAQFAEEDRLLSHKLAHWNRVRLQEKDRPPNVLIIGIDSVSRLNFHRFMNETKEVLEKEVGAIPMTGYTKVGDNTFPNAVSLLSGYTVEELRKICYESEETPQDKCPYLWRNFSELNYFTAHLEDHPSIVSFNYRKTGFIYKPVDLYYRPWMLAANKLYKRNHCLGNQFSEEILLKFVVDLIHLCESKGIPFFILTWLTHLTHEEVSAIREMDNLLANVLLHLIQSGVLKNTILLVMSDHGDRYGPFRPTMSGWFEDKLPVMFIKIPDTLTQKHPSWENGLQYNSKQLVTPFDIHAAFRDVLVDILETSYGSIASSQVTPNEGLERSASRGLSVFEKLPSRTCQEAGIPIQFCACALPSSSSVNLTLVVYGAQEVVRKINSELPSICVPQRLTKITAFAVVPDRLYNENMGLVNYIISLETTPGNFHYEAVVKIGKYESLVMHVEAILRTNKLVYGDMDCLTDKQAIVSEYFCYCKTVITSS